jgi:hypothetical protein
MRKIIYVVSHGQQWKMKCDHCSAEQITNTQTEAIKLARQHVASLPAGTLAEIRVQGVGGQWRTEWTYGKDPYPPPG